MSWNISEGTQNTHSKQHKHPYHCSVIRIAQMWKQPVCPSVDEWIKTTVGHLDSGILLDRKKRKEKKTFTFCSSIDGPGEHYVK